MIKRIATLILNRNLKDATDKLVEHIQRFDGELTDIFVIEAGSDKDRLSRYCTWHANWPEAIKHGLRYCRGMNYGLSQIWIQGNFKEYDAFFLLTNDTEFEEGKTLLPLVNILNQNNCIGILSPCSKVWGERLLLEHQATKFFWFIHNTAYLLRREFIETICNGDQPDFMNFLFDGTNFRGYGSESELIAKAYANDWAAAITKEVWTNENESHLLNHADVIKTESYNENLKLYIKEGQRWMKYKYGFNSRWSMQQYVKSFYDRFFEFHPEYETFRI